MMELLLCCNAKQVINELQYPIFRQFKLPKALHYSSLSIPAQQLQIRENAVDDKQTPSKQLLACQQWPITATQTNLSRHPKKQWQTKTGAPFLHVKEACSNRVQRGGKQACQNLLSLSYTKICLSCVEASPASRQCTTSNQLCRDTHMYTTTRSETVDALQEGCNTIKIRARESSKQRALLDTKTKQPPALHSCHPLPLCLHVTTGEQPTQCKTTYQQTNKKSSRRCDNTEGKEQQLRHSGVIAAPQGQGNGDRGRG